MRGASGRAALLWLAAVVAGAIVFEGLDLIGDNASVTAALPAVGSLPSISPFVAGAVAAWLAWPGVILPLLAGAATVWARIGLDLALGALRGARPPAEAGVVLVGFGLSWMISALVGAAITLIGCFLLRRSTHAEHQRQ